MARNKSVLDGVLAQKVKSKKTNDDVSGYSVSKESNVRCCEFSNSLFEISCISRHPK